MPQGQIYFFFFAVTPKPLHTFSSSKATTEITSFSLSLPFSHSSLVTIWFSLLSKPESGWLIWLETCFERHGRKLYHCIDADPLWPKSRPCMGLPWLPHSTPAWRRQPPSNTVTGAPKPHTKQTPHGSVLWNMQSVGQVLQQTTTAVRKRKMCWLLTEQLGRHTTDTVNDSEVVFSSQWYRSDEGFASHCLHHVIKEIKQWFTALKGTITQFWRMNLSLL